MTDDLVIHVVGNKIDLESQRKVSFSKVNHYCDRLVHDVSGVHEVSAKDNTGKNELSLSFSIILKLFITNRYRRYIL